MYIFLKRWIFYGTFFLQTNNDAKVIVKDCSTFPLTPLSSLLPLSPSPFPLFVVEWRNKNIYISRSIKTFGDKIRSEELPHFLLLVP